MSTQDTSQQNRDRQPLHMPVVAAAEDPDTEAADHFAAIESELVLTVTPAEFEGIQVELSNADYTTLYAMAGGGVRFVPAGMSLPKPDLGEGSEGEEPLIADVDCLVLQVHPEHVEELSRRLPPGVPPPKLIVYRNVDRDSAEEALAAAVRTIPQEFLEAYWNENPGEGDKTLDNLEEHYLESVMQRRRWVFVRGGAPLGEAGSGGELQSDAEASFILQFLMGSSGERSTLSPALHLNGMVGVAGPRWENHPLISAVADIPVAVDFHLRVEVFNEENNEYETMPELEVKLRHHRTYLPDQTIDQAETDQQGVVRFHYENLNDSPVAEKNLYFEFLTDGLEYGGQRLPKRWSTRGWYGADGDPGYYPAFSGTRIGTEIDPARFHVGVVLHGIFVFNDDDPRLLNEEDRLYLPHGRQIAVPRGVRVMLTSGKYNLDDLLPKIWLRTGSPSSGQVAALLTDIEAGDHIIVRVQAEIEDMPINEEPSANLPAARVRRRRNTDIDEWTFAFYDVDEASIGEPNGPRGMRITRNTESLYFLKTLRDLSVFLYHMTNGDWAGIEDLKLYRGARLYFLEDKVGSHAWPVRSVYLREHHHWDRRTIVHEVAHQIMWNEVGHKTLGIAYMATRNIVLERVQSVVESLGEPPIVGPLPIVGLPISKVAEYLEDKAQDMDVLYEVEHWVGVHVSPQHAFIDGWADFLGDMFPRSWPKNGGLITPNYPNLTNFSYPPYNIIGATVSIENGSTEVLRDDGGSWRSVRAGSIFHPGKDLVFPAYRVVERVSPNRLRLNRAYQGPTVSGMPCIIHRVLQRGAGGPFDLSYVDLDTSGRVTADSRNRGESVEGNVANGLFSIFRHHILGPDLGWDVEPFVLENLTGDITEIAGNAWVEAAGTNHVRDRFLEVIWEPFKALKDIPNRDVTSTAYFAKIKNHVSEELWSHLLGELQRFNMAMDPPIVETAQPVTQGNGTASLTITGHNFVAPIPALADPTEDVSNTHVMIGGEKVDDADVEVVRSTTLTAKVPSGAVAPGDVVVSTRAGTATHEGGYTT